MNNARQKIYYDVGFTVYRRLLPARPYIKPKLFPHSSHLFQKMKRFCFFLVVSALKPDEKAKPNEPLGDWDNSEFGKALEVIPATLSFYKKFRRNFSKC